MKQKIPPTTFPLRLLGEARSYFSLPLSWLRPDHHHLVVSRILKQSVLLWNEFLTRFFEEIKVIMDTTTWSNMFSVRISSHNPFTNFGVTVGGPTMKFADLRAKKKNRKDSSSSSGGSSPGLDDSLQDMMDHSGKKKNLEFHNFFFFGAWEMAFFVN